MPDDYEEHFRRHDEMLQGLARMFAVQHETNQEQRAMNQRIEGFIQEQRSFNADVRTTLARLETLVARMIEQNENGRDA